MTLRHVFDVPARAELDEGALFYERERPGWGAVFAAEVSRVIALVCEVPGVGAPVGRSGRRRVGLAGFPYDVVYRVAGETIRVVAVAHHKRRPGYYRSRA